VLIRDKERGSASGARRSRHRALGVRHGFFGVAAKRFALTFGSTVTLRTGLCRCRDMRGTVKIVHRDRVGLCERRPIAVLNDEFLVTDASSRAAHLVFALSSFLMCVYLYNSFFFFYSVYSKFTKSTHPACPVC